jgi:hypothetical protein
MNNIGGLLKKGESEQLLKRYTRNSPVRWKQVGFVMLPHKLLFDERLPRAALMVYWVLLVHQFEGKRECHPSMRLLEHETRYSRPTIIDAIKALEAQHWIEVERAHRRLNKYFVKLHR